MSRLRKDVKNLRKMGAEREAREAKFLESQGFRVETSRPVILWGPSGKPISQTRDMFCRMVPTGEFTRHKKPRPKYRYEGGLDAVAIHRTKYGVMVISQTTITPFCKETETEEGKKSITFDFHLSHGEPPFPEWEDVGPLIPDTTEARDAKDQSRVIHVADWFRKPELQKRWPLVCYLASYGHPGTEPVRMWWRPGVTNFVGGLVPSWVPLPKELIGAIHRRARGTKKAHEAGAARLAAAKVARQSPPEVVNVQ